MSVHRGRVLLTEKKGNSFVVPRLETGDHKAVCTALCRIIGQLAVEFHLNF